jgi:PEP-CTERM motif-containing protein
MNGELFGLGDFDSSLGTFTAETIVNSELRFQYQAFRGTRTFASDTTQVDFFNRIDNYNTSISFTAAETSDYAIGEEFQLGTLSITNGDWFWDPDWAEFTFTVMASSETAGLTDQTFSGTLRMLSTNDSDCFSPEQRADVFYIEEKPEFGSMRIFEYNPDMDVFDGDNTGSIEIWGAFGSLDLVEFRNPTAGVFLNDSIEAEPAPAVPEPSTILLFGLGILGLAGISRKKK